MHICINWSTLTRRIFCFLMQAPIPFCILNNKNNAIVPGKSRGVWRAIWLGVIAPHLPPPYKSGPRTATTFTSLQPVDTGPAMTTARLEQHGGFGMETYWSSKHDRKEIAKRHPCDIEVSCWDCSAASGDADWSSSSSNNHRYKPGK